MKFEVDYNEVNAQNCTTTPIEGARTRDGFCAFIYVDGAQYVKQCVDASFKIYIYIFTSQGYEIPGVLMLLQMVI